MTKPRQPPAQPPSRPFGQLRGLDALRERLPPGEPPRSAKPHGSEAKPGASTVYDRAPRIVVRYEKKGHGGKTVTRIEGLRGTAGEIDAAVKELKRSLGCGAALDDADILVQGDQTTRLVAFLETRGARKVVKGS